MAMEISENVRQDSSRKQSVVRAALKNVKTKLSLTDKGASPVNWKVVFLVFLSLFSSSFNITYLFPFLPEMIISFGYKETEKGFYSGIIASAMFIGRACGSYFWGWLSDKKGRKPIILLTLLLNGTFSLAFGFTTNIYVAFITRFLSGLSNGTVGTAKSILYEISDNTNQAVGMSIISVAWGSGIVAGPAIGGYLANPCQRYPDSFPSEGFFYQFPYIFPGLFAFIICIVAFVVDIIWLPETLNQKDREVVVDVDDNVGDETTSLHSTHLPNHHTHFPSYLTDEPKMSLSVENLHVESEGATYLAGSRKELHLTSRGISVTDVPDEKQKSEKIHKCGKHHCFSDNEISKHIRECTYDSSSVHSSPIKHCSDEMVTGALLSEKGEVALETITVDNGHNEVLDETEEKLVVIHQESGCCYSLKNWSPIYLIRQYDVFIAVLLYSLFSFSVIGVDDIFTVWTSTDILLDGLGFEPNEIGTVLGTTSLPLLFLQLFIFPNLIRRLGITKTLMFCSFVMMIVTQSLPCLHLLISRPVALWTLLLILLMIMKLMTSFVFSCTGLFINNSVTPDWAGSVNGLAMTVTAISRSMAPIFGGSLYSWTVGYTSDNIGPPLDVSFVFFLFGIVYWVNTLLGLMVPGRLDKQKK